VVVAGRAVDELPHHTGGAQGRLVQAAALTVQLTIAPIQLDLFWFPRTNE